MSSILLIDFQVHDTGLTTGSVVLQTSRTYSSCVTETLYLLKSNSPSPSPLPLAPTILFCFYKFHTSYNQNHALSVLL